MRHYSSGKYMPESILREPTVMRLRNELAEVCRTAIKVAKASAKGRVAEYDYDNEEYVKLAAQRDQIIQRILRYWNAS